MDPVPAIPGEDWIPYRVRWTQDHATVDWCYAGGARFTEPFFEDTIRRIFSRPFSATFIRRTPMEALEAAGGPDPCGIIFHMSRCGSTLVSQMLKAISGVTVMAEPPPVDSIVRASQLGCFASEEQHAEWLRWIVRALGRYGGSGQRKYVLKTDCWHIRDLALFRQAFPGTPQIFLYRDPLEVLASHANQPAPWSLPGYLDAKRFGFDASGIAPSDLTQYRARLLAGMLHRVLACGPEWNGRLVNFSQLPEWGWSKLPKIFGLNPSAEEITAMQTVATHDSKRSPLPFVPDAEWKRSTASPQIQALSQTHLYPLYCELEALRCKGDHV